MRLLPSAFGRTRIDRCACVLLIGVLACGTTFASEPLRVERVIALGPVNGRIDHLAVDLARQRLFVAELGNNSVGAIDLADDGKVRTLSGFAEPQGVAYDSASDTLYVTNGGDGTVRFYSAGTLEATGRIELGEDADNVRIDAAAKTVLVGFGERLAVINAHTYSFRTIPLGGHPESFQVASALDRIFVNVPSAHQVVSLDTKDGALRIPIPIPGRNFPLAIDDTGGLILPLRHPAKLLVIGDGGREPPSTADLCEDADDVFFDARRGHLYVSCGDGHLDVFERRESGYSRVGHIATAAGARTSLFVAEWDQLFVAVPALGTTPSAVWVMRPN